MRTPAKFSAADWNNLVGPKGFAGKFKVWAKKDKEAVKSLIESIETIARLDGAGARLCLDRNYEVIPCKDKKDGQIEKTLEEKRRQTEEQQNNDPSKIYVKLVESVSIPYSGEKDKKYHEEMSALSKISNSVKSGADITKLVEKVAKEDNKNISNNFINVLFMIFVESLKYEERPLYTYVSGNFSERIKFAASRALALYSADRLNINTGSEILNNPAGYFFLESYERKGILNVFKNEVKSLNLDNERDALVYSMIVGDLGRIYDIKNGETATHLLGLDNSEQNRNIANYLAAVIIPMISQNTGSVIFSNPTADGFFIKIAVEQLPKYGLALQRAGNVARIVSIAGEAASSYGGYAVASTLGEAAIVIGPLVVFYIALEDAYQYPIPIQLLLKDYSSLVQYRVEDDFNIESSAGNIQDVVPWQENWVAYGIDSKAENTPNSCKRNPNPDNSCRNIKFNQLQERNAKLHYKIKQYFKENPNANVKKSTPVADLINYIGAGSKQNALRMFISDCGKVQGTRGDAFAKIAEVDGRYMMEYEVKVDLKQNNIPLKKVFSQNIWRQICRSQSFLNAEPGHENLILNNGMSLRNRDHEKNKGHIHLEDKNGGYICNHTIFFNDSEDFLTQAIKICREMFHR